MSEERWRAIPCFEGSYEVSDMGRVRSLDRFRAVNDSMGRCYDLPMRGRTLRPQKHSAGYSHVQICGKVRLIQHLVLEAFVGPRPPGNEALHGDGNKRSNVIENLRWGTPQENCEDKVLHGTHSRGERNGAAKLTTEVVLAIRAASGFQDDIAAIFGVTQQQVSRIKNRTRWAHV